MGKQERQEAKKDREQTKKEEVKSKASKAADDAQWGDDAPGGKGSKKKEDEERKKAEAAARKAEAKKLLEEEEAQLSSKAKKLAPAGAQKVTKYHLDIQKEHEAKQKEEQLKEKDMATKRELTEDAYHSLVVTENLNRGDSAETSARNVTEALSVLGVKDSAEADKHPEKRMRAAWLAYEERNLPLVKQEKPGMKMSQYKDLLWKQWQKAPENPLNQGR